MSPDLRSVLAAVVFPLAFAGVAAADAITIPVPAVAGDPVASGAALRDAYNTIANAPGQHPAVFLLDAGSYDVGAVPLEITRAHLHFQGAGRAVTSITGTGFAVLLVHADLEISGLAVENGNGSGITALDGFVDVHDADIHAQGGPATAAMGVNSVLNSSVRLVDVHIENGTPSDGGVNLLGDAAPSVLANVTIVGGAILGTKVNLENVDVDTISIYGKGPVAGTDVGITGSRIGAGVPYGILGSSNGASKLVIQDSEILATLVSLLFDSTPSANIVILDSLVSSQVVVFANNRIRCVGAYGPSGAPLDSECQPLP